MSQGTQLEVNSLVPLQVFLSQLNNDTWSQVMLPTLIEQGSAGAVALTCRQLRDVMYHGVQQVNLSSLTGYALNPAEAKRLVYSVPQRFPGCTSVQLLVDSKKACTVAGSVLPTLKRLPSLSDMKMTVPTPLSLTALRTLLCSIHKQLKSLSSLNMHVQHQQGWAGADRVWQALGRFTQLTELFIHFYSEETAGCTGKDLEMLRGLSQLQLLDISVGGQGIMKDCTPCQPLLTKRLLQPLTALTSLDFDVCTLDDMVAVSVCSTLQELLVNCYAGDGMNMTDVHWHALGVLTRLTLLSMTNALVLDAPPASFAALRRLAKLQNFGALVMSTPLLPALAACTQLTCVAGGWSQCVSDSQVAGCGFGTSCESVVLPTVVELDCARGAVPFAAFPNIQEFSHNGTVELSSWHALGSCSTALRTLECCHYGTDAAVLGSFCSLPSHEPIAAHVACLQSCIVFGTSFCLCMTMLSSLLWQLSPVL